MDGSTPCVFDDAEFCALKQTLMNAYGRMASEQLLELADHLHDAIRARQADPKSGHDSCADAAPAD